MRRRRRRLIKKLWCASKIGASPWQPGANLVGISWRLLERREREHTWLVNKRLPGAFNPLIIQYWSAHGTHWSLRRLLYWIHTSSLTITSATSPESGEQRSAAAWDQYNWMLVSEVCVWMEAGSENLVLERERRRSTAQIDDIWYSITPAAAAAERTRHCVWCWSETLCAQHRRRFRSPSGSSRRKEALVTRGKGK